MKKCLYIFSGEGTRSADTGCRLLEQSSLWESIQVILSKKLKLELEEIWQIHPDTHRGPYGPLITVISAICLADIWKRWGYRPDVVVGHSTGELAASYEAGLYSLDEILVLAHQIGTVASQLEGRMIHGVLPDDQLRDLAVNVSGFNFKVGPDTHVTLSGPSAEIESFQQVHPDFVKMKIGHLWHHPDYLALVDRLDPVASRKTEAVAFVSAITGAFETTLPVDHWRRWLVQPVDFIGAMHRIQERYDGHSFDIVEIGFHPVLKNACKDFANHRYASSMYRGEEDITWILSQRSQLSGDVLLDQLHRTIEKEYPRLDFDQPLAYQGFDSLAFTKLSIILQPYFPSLAPQDFYRHKTIHQLIRDFGRQQPAARLESVGPQKNDVVIAGMSCRFPSAVENLTQFWDMLRSKEDQVALEKGRGSAEAGYLNASTTRFDHDFFNIPSAEARTMDPQQILALELTEMLWRDSGIDPEALDRGRVGVYIGAWSQEYGGDRASVFYPTGTNPSLIAARISYQYDLRGPSWVSNTACSSSLVAVHYAQKDIEAGRVDYAIAGGVNMLLDEKFTESMRFSGFLSADNRCKAFDDAANGYVRAEGGGLVLLANKSRVDRYYATLAGSAVNQNGRRAQLITAPHPQAQEEVIAAACSDARIQPNEIAYVECHGTGTKIGDPIEISAIQNTIASNRRETCFIGSVKSNIGHLESAAGIAGLIKSVAALNHGIIPPNLQFNQPNSHIDFQSHRLQVVTGEIPIDHQAAIGVSSFGFGGTNAHLVIKGASADVRKEIEPVAVPFDRENGLPLAPYLRLTDPATALPAAPTEAAADKAASGNGHVTRAKIDKLVCELFFELTSIPEIDPDIEMTEQGLDSMSGTELVAQLETSFDIEIDPDILFEFPLKDQFVDEVYALAHAN